MLSHLVIASLGAALASTDQERNLLQSMKPSWWSDSQPVCQWMGMGPSAMCMWNQNGAFLLQSADPFVSYVRHNAYKKNVLKVLGQMNMMQGGQMNMMGMCGMVNVTAGQCTLEKTENYCYLEKSTNKCMDNPGSPMFAALGTCFNSKITELVSCWSEAAKLGGECSESCTRASFNPDIAGVAPASKCFPTSWGSFVNVDPNTLASVLSVSFGFCNSGFMAAALVNKTITNPSNWYMPLERIYAKRPDANAEAKFIDRMDMDECMPAMTEADCNGLASRNGGMMTVTWDLVTPNAPGFSDEVPVIMQQPNLGMDMTMVMWFSNSLKTTLWLKEWNIDTEKNYAGVCVGLFFFAIFHEAMVALRGFFYKYNCGSPKTCSDGGCGCRREAYASSALYHLFNLHPLVVRAALFLLYFLNAFCGYLLMLAVMTYASGFFWSIIFGLAFGHVIFFRKPTKSTDTLVMQMNNKGDGCGCGC